MIKGRHSRGEKVNTSVLKEWQVIDIRKSKDTRYMLAKKYNVGYSAICDIISGRTWRYLIDK